MECVELILAVQVQFKTGNITTSGTAVTFFVHVPFQGRIQGARWASLPPYIAPCMFIFYLHYLLFFFPFPFGFGERVACGIWILTVCYSSVYNYA